MLLNLDLKLPHRKYVYCLIEVGGGLCFSPLSVYMFTIHGQACGIIVWPAPTVSSVLW